MTLYSATVPEIELVCSYIDDDQRVANYFGISVKRVEHVRAAMRTNAREFHIGQERYGDGTKKGGTGLDAHKVAAEDAEVGSEKLKRGIQRLFRRWEQDNGFQFGAAQILLPAGYVPQSEAA
jgi:hypothetical protein